MFGGAGITGLAVITGSVSGGLAVRDLDREDSYHRWAQAHSDVAAHLPTAKTSRGYHVYTRLEAETYLTLDDGELRADNRHYVLLPPSHHPGGTLYRWLIPLPDGDLPIVDPVSIGLVPALSQEQDRQATQATQATQDTHCMCPPVDGAISATLPSGPGQRNRQLFDLARHLKAIKPHANHGDLLVILQEWHRQALPTISTKDFAVTWEDFANAWVNVKVPLGATWNAISRRAKTPSLTDARAKLVKLCAALQEHHGLGKPWPLACRKAGKEIGVSYQKAARLLKLLQFEKVIQLVTEGGPKGSLRAAEYLFLGDKA